MEEVEGAWSSVTFVAVMMGHLREVAAARKGTRKKKTRKSRQCSDREGFELLMQLLAVVSGVKDCFLLDVVGVAGAVTGRDLLEGLDRGIEEGAESLSERDALRFIFRQVAFIDLIPTGDVFVTHCERVHKRLSSRSYHHRFIDVSAGLASPVVLKSRCDDTEEKTGGEEEEKVVRREVVPFCGKRLSLLHKFREVRNEGEEGSFHCVLRLLEGGERDPPPSVCFPCIGGILLDYPVVYWLSSPPSSSGGAGNCLGGRALARHTVALTREQVLTMSERAVLQEEVERTREGTGHHRQEVLRVYEGWRGRYKGLLGEEQILFQFTHPVEDREAEEGVVDGWMKGKKSLIGGYLGSVVSGGCVQRGVEKLPMVSL
eukprot:Nk52_evm1s2135 gene=Nk52_evmTU1s2135